MFMRQKNNEQVPTSVPLAHYRSIPSVNGVANFKGRKMENYGYFDEELLTSLIVEIVRYDFYINYSNVKGMVRFLFF